MTWFSGLEAICRNDVPLCEHTWYRLGGPARWLLTPRNEAELTDVVRRCQNHGIPWRALGQGANLLVREAGFEGAVIKLSGAFWEGTELDGTRVTAGAGADFPRLVRQTVETGLVGLENLAGIPGTVGGVIRMNAGGRYGCIADYVDEVRLVAPDGTRATRTRAELEFAYRRCALGGGIVTAAVFALRAGAREDALARHRQIWNEKYASQPAVSVRSAGCIFKNPPGNAAGRLVDQAGLKGHRCGGAEISSKHANFIVAHPGAAAQDVLDLIALARQRVYQATGIELELEVEVW